MAERTIASVLKTVEALRSPGVRIPLSPPLAGGRRKAAPSASFVLSLIHLIDLHFRTDSYL